MTGVQTCALPISHKHGKSLAPEVRLDNWLSNSEFNYLEIGCFDGYNLAVLAEKFPNKTIYGIDPFINDGNISKVPGESIPGIFGEPLLNQKAICNSYICSV